MNKQPKVVASFARRLRRPGLRSYRWVAAGLLSLSIATLSIGCNGTPSASTPAAAPTPTVKAVQIGQPTPGVSLTPAGTAQVSPLPAQSYDHYWRGDAKATVVIEEWSDLQ